MPWIICGILIVTVIILAVRVISLQKYINEICKATRDAISENRNADISISYKDPYIKKQAGEICKNLNEVRRLSLKYRVGNREMKDAITNISHDLRTPLTAIYGYLDLYESVKDSEHRDRYLEKIRERCDAMKELTEELFRYTLIVSSPTLTLSDENLGRILENSLLSLSGALKNRGIEPIIDIPTAPVRRYVDPKAVTRIYGNIIENAIKYSDGDFAVKLREDGSVTFTNGARNLSTIEVGHLFDRYFTVDRSKRGAGIGLSIAKFLTEEMRGNISAEYKNARLSITVKFN